MTSLNLKEAVDKYGMDQVYRILDWIYFNRRIIPRGEALKWALDNKLSNHNTKHMTCHIWTRTLWNREGHPQGYVVEFINGRNQTRLQIMFTNSELEEFLSAGNQERQATG